MLAFEGTISAQAHYAMGCHQRGDTRNTEFGGFFNQPIHALIGRHAYHHMAQDSTFALNCAVRVYACSNRVTPHLKNAGLVLTAAPIEQGDDRTRL